MPGPPRRFLQHAGLSAGALLERARAVHRASMADYLAQRGDLAAEAGELASLFREPTLQEQFDQAGKQLLLVVGMELLRRRPRPAQRTVAASRGTSLSGG